MATLRKWSTIVWFTMMVMLVIYGLSRQPISIEIFKERISFGMLVMSFILIIIGKLMTIALVWFSLCSAGENRGWRFAWKSYSLADISKYLPGGFWGIAGRLAIYNKAGIGLSKSVRLLLTETGVIVSFSFVTGIAAWVISQSALELPAILGGLLVVVGAFFLIVAIAFPKLSFGLQCLSILSNTVSWVAFGLSFAIVVSPTFESYIEFVGRHNLGFAAGQIAIFAPSGIGVREFVISWLSNNPLEDMRLTIEYVFIHRIIWIVADVIVLLIILFLSAAEKYRLKIVASDKL